MASSLQREESFVGIATGILEALARTEWHQHERRVLDVIFLETYGKPDPENKGKQLTRKRLSSQEIAEKTNLNPRLVRIALGSLVNRNVLTCFEEPAGCRSGVYGFQKYPERWTEKGRTSRASRVRLPDTCPPAIAGHLSSGKPQLPDTCPPAIAGHLSSGKSESNAQMIRLAGHLSSGYPDTCPPANHEESRTTSSIPDRLECRNRSTDRSIDQGMGLPPDLFDASDPWARVCPYRTALQILRPILNAKEESRLKEFQRLEGSFSREQLLDALKRRVQEASLMSDRGKRTCWVLIKAAEDLVAGRLPAPVAAAGHSPAELEFEDED